MGEYGGLLVAAQDKPCMQVPFLIKPATYQFRVSASFFSLSVPSVYGGPFQISPRKLLSVWTNNWWASQATKEMGLGKEAYSGEILSCPSVSMWEGWSVCLVLVDCHMYMGIHQMLAGLIHLFEELCRAHCDREVECMAAQWAGHQCSARSWRSS